MLSAIALSSASLPAFAHHGDATQLSHLLEHSLLIAGFAAAALALVFASGLYRAIRRR